jgi:hypothetical protein
MAVMPPSVAQGFIRRHSQVQFPIRQTASAELELMHFRQMPSAEFRYLSSVEIANLISLTVEAKSSGIETEILFMIVPPFYMLFLVNKKNHSSI